MLKPLGLMGGDGIKIVTSENSSKVLEQTMVNSSEMMMLQNSLMMFIPEIEEFC